MGQEIERKFLINREKWEKAEKPRGEKYRQGYMVSEPEKTIRVRVTEAGGYITIKGKTYGATRAEYEYAIPIEDAEELIDKFCNSELSKVRYVINFKGKKGEGDEFSGDNKGLIIAEIELVSEGEEFEKPDWTGEEGTGDARYYNSNLAKRPYKKKLGDGGNHLPKI